MIGFRVPGQGNGVEQLPTIIFRGVPHCVLTTILVILFPKC